MSKKPITNAQLEILTNRVLRDIESEIKKKLDVFKNSGEPERLTEKFDNSHEGKLIAKLAQLKIDRAKIDTEISTVKDQIKNHFDPPKKNRYGWEEHSYWEEKNYERDFILKKFIFRKYSTEGLREKAEVVIKETILLKGLENMDALLAELKTECMKIINF